MDQLEFAVHGVVDNVVMMIMIRESCVQRRFLCVHYNVCMSVYPFPKVVAVLV